MFYESVNNPSIYIHKERLGFSKLFHPRTYFKYTLYTFIRIQLFTVKLLHDFVSLYDASTFLEKYFLLIIKIN